MAPNPAASRGKRHSVSILGPHPLALQYLVALLEPHYEVCAWLEPGKDHLFFQSDAIIIDGGEVPAARSIPLVPPPSLLSKAKLSIVSLPLSKIQLCKLISIGIHGFVCYDQADVHLQAAIQAVLRGRLW